MYPNDKPRTANVLTKFLSIRVLFIGTKDTKQLLLIQKFRGVGVWVGLYYKHKANSNPSSSIDNQLGVGRPLGQMFLIHKMKNILCLRQRLLFYSDVRVTMNMKVL